MVYPKTIPKLILGLQKAGFYTMGDDKHGF
jgi:hypothetical protein